MLQTTLTPTNIGELAQALDDAVRSKFGYPAEQMLTENMLEELLPVAAQVVAKLPTQVAHHILRDELVAHIFRQMGMHEEE